MKIPILSIFLLLSILLNHSAFAQKKVDFVNPTIGALDIDGWALKIRENQVQANALFTNFVAAVAKEMGTNAPPITLKPKTFVPSGSNMVANLGSLKLTLDISPFEGETVSRLNVLIRMMEHPSIKPFYKFDFGHPAEATIWKEALKEHFGEEARAGRTSAWANYHHTKGFRQFSLQHGFKREILLNVEFRGQ